MNDPEPTPVLAIAARQSFPLGQPPKFDLKVSNPGSKPVYFLSNMLEPQNNDFAEIAIENVRRCDDLIRIRSIDKPEKLPSKYWSNGVAQSSTFGEVTGHELAHGRARLTKDPDSDGASLRLQNKVRTKVNHKTVTRILH